jgi:hypothetical protein
MDKRNWLYIKEIRTRTDLGTDPEANKYSIPCGVDTEIVLSDGSILGGVLSATWSASIDSITNHIKLEILQTENLTLDLTLGREHYKGKEAVYNLGSEDPVE